MRDPKRIAAMLGRLELLWVETPDLRLGQLIENVIGDKDMVWSMEDDVIYERLGIALNAGWNALAATNSRKPRKRP